jgi:hypothetical protein
MAQLRLMIRKEAQGGNWWAGVYDDVDEGLIAMGARGGGLGNKENQVSANTTLEVINT